MQQQHLDETSSSSLSHKRKRTDGTGAGAGAGAGEGTFSPEHKDGSKDEESSLKEGKEKEKDAVAVPGNEQSVERKVKELKDEGNKLFGEKHFEDAIAKYEEAVKLIESFAAGCDDAQKEETELHSMAPALWSNLSGAKLAMGNARGALQAAQSCIDSDPRWIKGYSRKGAALLQLGSSKAEEAIKAYAEALKIDPQNQVAMEGKIAAQQLFQRRKPYSAVASSSSSSSASSLTGAPSSSSSSPSMNQATTQSRQKNSGENDEQTDDDPFSSFLDQLDEMDEEEEATKREKESKVEKVSSDFIVDHEAETKGWTGQSQIERILQRNHRWLNLNPYHVFGLDYKATMEDIKKRFRKLSALVHPDKNKDSRASEAFEEVKKSYAILKDDDKRNMLLETVQACKSHVGKTRNKMRKKGLSEAEIVKREGKFEDAVDRELKKELATREHARIKSEELRQKNEERELRKSAEVQEHWRRVKEQEESINATRDDRAKQWQGFVSKRKKN